MANEIRILSEIEAVRQSPGMYIGSTENEGAHHLFFEIVHNALDEVLVGHCDKITVRLEGGVCEVEDNGRGIPTETHSEAGIPACEVALTRLHAGSKFEKDDSEFTTGLHGVGLSCVNALSENLSVTIHRGGSQFEQKYQRGVAQAALKVAGKSDSTGTTVRFAPDKEIFKSFEHFDVPTCRDFVENLALLNPGLEIHFIAQGQSDEVFMFDGKGLTGIYQKYSQDKKLLFAEPIAIDVNKPELRFSANLAWSTDMEPDNRSFVNCVETRYGGSHLNAFRSGILRAVNKMMPEISQAAWKGSPAEMVEVCEGLMAVLHCKVRHPKFEGQTKTRFTNREVVNAIEEASFQQCSDFFKANPKVATIVFERITDARNARLASRRVAESVFFRHGQQEINEEVYKKQFGERSKTWHDSAVWITHDELLKSHADLCQVDEDSIALDVCCGSGVVGASFKKKVKKVIGLDLTPEMVKLSSQRLDEVVQGNVYNIPFEDNKFDMVCTREVLHLLPYPERPVSEIFRVLKPGGQFIVGQILPFNEDDGAWMYRVFKKKQPLIYNMFQEEDFRHMLLSAGFVNLEMTEMNVWESIDVWIDSYETTPLHRHEIREIFHKAPEEAKAAHPFEIKPSGEIMDLWRWCVFSVWKPES